MKCPHCGAEASGKYCSFCGSELPQVVPNEVNYQNNSNNTVYHNVTNIYYAQPPVQQPAAVHVPMQAQPQFYSYVSSKNKDIAFLLWFFLGLLGGHLFYVGRWKKGLLYLCTGGLLGLGWIVDFFQLASNNFKDADNLPLKGKIPWSGRIIGGCLMLISFCDLLNAPTSSDQGSILFMGFCGLVFFLLSFKK